MVITAYRFFKYFIICLFFKIFLRNRCPVECDATAFRCIITGGAKATLGIKFLIFSAEICFSSPDGVATTYTKNGYRCKVLIFPFT